MAPLSMAQRMGSFQCKILVVPGAFSLDVLGPLEVFSTAASLWPENLSGESVRINVRKRDKSEAGAPTAQSPQDWAPLRGWAGDDRRALATGTASPVGAPLAAEHRPLCEHRVPGTTSPSGPADPRCSAPSSQGISVDARSPWHPHGTGHEKRHPAESLST